MIEGSGLRTNRSGSATRGGGRSREREAVAVVEPYGLAGAVQVNGLDGITVGNLVWKNM